MQKRFYPIIPVIIFSLLLSSCGGEAQPGEDTEPVYAEVTLPPLVTTPGASLDGSDIDMFGAAGFDVVTDVYPEDPRPVTLTKTVCSDHDGYIDLAEYVCVDGSGLLFVKRPPEPETEPPPEPETDENGEMIPVPEETSAETGENGEPLPAETTTEPETTEPDYTGLPVCAVVTKDVTKFDRSLYEGLVFDAFAVEKGNAAFVSRWGMLYDVSGEKLLMYPVNSGQTECETPAGTRVIGESAFEGAVSLTAIWPAAELEFVSKRAFAGCSALKGITLGDSTLYVGEEAFDGCVSLEKLVVGASLVSVGSHACRGCVSLTVLDVHNPDFHTIRLSPGEIPFSDTPWYNGFADEFLLLSGLLVKYTPQDDGGETYIDFTVRWIPAYAVSGTGPRTLYMSRDIRILGYDEWDPAVEISYI